MFAAAVGVHLVRVPVQTDGGRAIAAAHLHPPFDPMELSCVMWRSTRSVEVQHVQCETFQRATWLFVVINPEGLANNGVGIVEESSAMLSGGYDVVPCSHTWMVATRRVSQHRPMC